LTAVVIEAASQDFRDSIVALAKLYHSAAKLGMDTKKAFEEAASLAEPGIVKAELKGFASRPAKDRDLRLSTGPRKPPRTAFITNKSFPWSLPQGISQRTPTAGNTPTDLFQIEPGPTTGIDSNGGNPGGDGH
jgi:hypothetical protein